MKKWLIGLLVVVLMVIGGVASQKSQQPPEQPTTTVNFRDPTTNLSLDYPAELMLAELTNQDRQDKILLRLQQDTTNQPPLLITLRYEQGIKKAANLLRREPLDVILDSIDKSYPQRFPGYQPTSQRRLEVSGRKAAEVLFSYQKDPSAQRLKQRLLIIIKDDDTALYLAAQAQEPDFEKANSDVFEPIFQSVALP